MFLDKFHDFKLLCDDILWYFYGLNNKLYKYITKKGAYMTDFFSSTFRLLPYYSETKKKKRPFLDTFIFHDLV